MASASAVDKASEPPSLDVAVEAGKVGAVRNQLLLQGDEGLANRLQDVEFEQKYNWNRNERRTARKDVPLAKVVHTEEEEKLQKEYFERLERDKQRAEMDAKIALEMQKEERLRNDLAVVETRDSLFARQLLREESAELAMRAQQDEQLAVQMQKEEVFRKHNERLQRELDDQSLARRLQEREHQLAEMANRERLLQQQHRNHSLVTHQIVEPIDVRRDVLHRQLLIPIDITDSPELTEADESDLFFDDDAQLARELHQLQLEQVRAAGTQAYDIERSDARLARILQEQERLDALRRAEERRIRRIHQQLSMQQPYMVERSQSARVQQPLQPPSYSRYPVSSRAYSIDDCVETHHYDRGYTVVDPSLYPHASDRAHYANGGHRGGAGITSPLHSRPVRSELPDDFLRYTEPASRRDDAPGRAEADPPVYAQPVRGNMNSASDRAGSDREASYPRADNNVQLPRKKGKSSESSCKQQ